MERGVLFTTSGPVHVPAHDLDEAVVDGHGAVVPAVRVKLGLVEAHAVATLLSICTLGPNCPKSKD